MPIVFDEQDFTGVIIRSRVTGEAGNRVGQVQLAELNMSGKTGHRAVPEHVQTLTVKEQAPGEVELTLGVQTTPSDSPEWLRKGFLRPWATWHIEIDEADKMRHLTHRVFPDQPLAPNPMHGAVGRGLLAGALVGAGLGAAALASGLVGNPLLGLGVATGVGSLLGMGAFYYQTGEALKATS